MTKKQEVLIAAVAAGIVTVLVALVKGDCPMGYAVVTFTEEERLRVRLDDLAASELVERRIDEKIGPDGVHRVLVDHPAVGATEGEESPVVMTLREYLDQTLGK